MVDNAENTEAIEKKQSMKMITLYVPIKVIEGYDHLVENQVISNRSETMRAAIISHLIELKRLEAALNERPQREDKVE